MNSAAYTLKRINSKSIKLSDIEKATNAFMSLAEMYRWLGITKESCPQLIEYITQNCLDEFYIRNRPSFKIALNKNNKPLFYLVEKAFPYFLTKHKETLLEFGVDIKNIEFALNRFTPQQKNDDTTITIYQLLTMLKPRNQQDRYSDIPRKTVEAWLKETYIDENNTEQPVCIYIKVPQANKTNLSVARKNIPYFIKKYGAELNINEHLVQEIQETKDLPYQNDKMIAIMEFSRLTHSPDGFMYWLQNMAKVFFKKDFEGENPVFIDTKSNVMTKVCCLNKEKISDFILKNQAILLTHGFNPNFLKMLKENKFDINKKDLKKPERTTLFHADFPFPMIRINQLTDLLNKSTNFIQPLKEFIVNNCLNDTFDLTLYNNQKIKAPVFSYYKSFSSEPTLYVYEKAIPEFVHRYFIDLLKLDVPFKTLNDLLNQTEHAFPKHHNAWTLKELYQHSFSSLNEKEFYKILSACFKDTFYTTNNAGKKKKMPIFIHTQNKRFATKILTTAIPELLKKTKEKLGLSNDDCQRLLLLINQEKTSDILKINNFITELQIPLQNKEEATAFLQKHQKMIIPASSKNQNPVILFGYHKSKEYGFNIGIYQNAITSFLNLFEKDLLALGANQEKINEMKVKYDSSQTVTPQPVLIQKQKTPLLKPEGRQMS